MDAIDRLRDLAVSDSGFIFDPRSGATFSANASARMILAGLIERQEMATIAGALRDAFRVEDRDLQRDIGEFVHLLRSHGLVPGDYVLGERDE